MADYIFNSKKALPNKMLQKDGTITDLLGNPVVSPVEAYNSKEALPNKWLNPDGSYSTLAEIIAEAVDTDIFVVVEELPASGETNKIYLLIKDDKLIEYHWTGSKWDPVGMVEFDVSKYSTTEEIMNMLEVSALSTLNSAKAYTDEQIAGMDIPIFYWDGKTDETGVAFWNEVVTTNKNDNVLVIGESEKNTGDNTFSTMASFEKNHFNIQTGSKRVCFTPYNIVSNIVRDSYHVRSQKRRVITLTFSNGAVTAVQSNEYTDSVQFLATNHNYAEPFIPVNPGAPATKKYVDDSIADIQADPQVFYWNRTTDSIGVDTWNEIMNVNDTQPVMVVWFVNGYGRCMYVSESIGEIREKKSISAYSYQLVSRFLPGHHEIQGTTITLIFTLSEEGVITNVRAVSSNVTLPMLFTNSDYSQPYEPVYAGSPATKKYVDDSIATNITNVLNESY